MTLFRRLSSIPPHIYVLICAGIFLVTALATYFVREDTHLIEKRIASKQKDVGTVLQLRDSYEMKKRAFDRYAPGKTDHQGISLALMEEVIAKSFIGGSLTSLQLVTTKEDKGGQHMAVEVKVTGAPLGEVISFIRATESGGLRVGKLRLSLPAANPTVLDMQATVMERRFHG
jgi:hypothetical protein